MKEPPDNESILAAIRQGDREIVPSLYRQNRDAFLRWAKRHFNSEEADLLDVFQDAVIAFYLQVVEKKVETITVSVDAYLFGIAKNLLYRKFGEKRKLTPVDKKEEQFFDPVLPEVFKKIELTHQQHILQEGIKKLSAKCQEILTLFYYYDHGLEVIADRLNYKNTDTVKNQKKRCMKQLTEIVRTAAKKKTNG